jgi:hypothetical protein
MEEGGYGVALWQLRATLSLYARGPVRSLTWVGFGPDPNQAMIEEIVESIETLPDRFYHRRITNP